MNKDNIEISIEILSFSELEEYFKNKKEKIANSILKDVMEKDELSFYRFLTPKIETFTSRKSHKHVEITTDNINKMYNEMVFNSRMEEESRIKKEKLLAFLLKDNMSEEEISNHRFWIEKLENFNKEL